MQPRSSPHPRQGRGRGRGWLSRRAWPPPSTTDHASEPRNRAADSRDRGRCQHGRAAGCHQAPCGERSSPRRSHSCSPALRRNRLLNCGKLTHRDRGHASPAHTCFTPTTPGIGSAPSGQATKSSVPGSPRASVTAAQSSSPPWASVAGPCCRGARALSLCHTGRTSSKRQLAAQYDGTRARAAHHGIVHGADQDQSVSGVLGAAWGHRQSHAGHDGFEAVRTGSGQRPA